MRLTRLIVATGDDDVEKDYMNIMLPLSIGADISTDRGVGRKSRLTEGHLKSSMAARVRFQCGGKADNCSNYFLEVPGKISRLEKYHSGSCAGNLKITFF